MKVLKHSPLTKIFLLALFSSQSVTGVIAASEKTISETFTNNSTADYLISNSGSGRNRESIAYSDDTGFGWGGYNAETAGSGASIAMRDNTNDIRIKDTTRNLNNANRSQTYLYTLFSANAAGGDLAPTELIDLSGANAEIIFETTTAAPDQQIRFLLRDRNNEWYLSDDTVSVSRNTTKNYNISTFSWKKIAETTATDMNELDGGGESLITTNSSSNPDFSEVSGGGFFIHQGFSVLTDELRVSSMAWRGSDITTTPSVVNITLEAEDYTAVSDVNNDGVEDFTQNTRADASNGAYMQSGSVSNSYLEYQINLPKDDVYEIAVRGAGTSGSTNSFRVSVDGGADSVVQLSKDDTWGWKTVTDADSGLGPYILSAGQHIIRIAKREANAKIDQLKISTVSFETPTKPLAKLAVDSINFGTLSVGGISDSTSLTLTNNGSAPLTIDSVSVSQGFIEINDCNGSLPAGSRCAFTVSFIPINAGNISGTLTIVSNDSASPSVVNLSGIGSDGTQTANTLLYVDFNDHAESLYTKQDIMNDFNARDSDGLIHGPDWDSTYIVADPTDNPARGNVLRTIHRAGYGGVGGPGDLGSGMRWEARFPAADDVYLAYDLYLQPDHEWMLQSKLPGLNNAPLNKFPHVAGAPPEPNGSVGFTTSMQLYSNDAFGRGDGGLITNFYDADKVQGSNWLDDVDAYANYNYKESRNTQYHFPRGEWVTIELRIKMNTASGGPGYDSRDLKDGLAEVWINGVLKSSVPHRWITKDGIKINGIVMYDYYGGNPGDPRNQPSKDQFQYYDNFRVSTSPITH